MDLLLWRHAEALDPVPGQDDLSRALTPRGERQAERMARWLQRHLPENAKIYSSPAWRTRQTAQALSRPFLQAPALSPWCDSADLLQVVGWPDAAGCALVVGHQPVLGQTVAQLLGVPGAELAIKKGAVWWLRARQRNGRRETVLLSVQHPDLL